MKTVIVSGGTSGIGKAAVLRLLDDGFNVATFSRSSSKCRILDKELSSKYDQTRFLAIPADVTDKKSLDSFVKVVHDKYKGVDILVNNAGIGYFSDCDDIDDAQFNSMIKINLVGIALLTSLVVPYMKKKKSGQIINIASMSGKRSYPRGEFYSATKFAVMGYSDGIRKELEQYGIKVSTICPGLVRTNFLDEEFFDRKKKEGKPVMAAEDISRIISLICTQSEHSNIQDVSVLPF